MAKGRRNQDNFLRNVLIGFVGLFVVLGIAAVLLNAFGPKDDYNDFTTIKNITEVETQKETNYVVYFYSETCGACSSIKAETMKFGDKNALDLKMYLVDTDRVNGSPTVIQDQLGAYVDSTPTMVVVRNGEIVSMFKNTTNITNFYKSVEDGSYTFY